MRAAPGRHRTHARQDGGMKTRTWEDLTDEEFDRALRNSRGFVSLYPEFALSFLEDDAAVTENRKQEQQTKPGG